MRKRTYICGPITKGDLKHNLDQATEAFVRLAKFGFAPFCPHWSAFSKPTQKRRRIVYCSACQVKPKLPLASCDQCEYGFEVWCQATIEGNDQMGHSDWMQVDLSWVEVSDCVLRLTGESKGSDAEVEHATKLGIPVYYSIEDLVAAEGKSNGTA